MSASASKLNAYTTVNVETASQGKLVVMLFNGAIKRAEEAKRQLTRGKAEAVHNNLIRAQDIVAELRSALDMKAHPVALDLDRIYEYFQHLLIQANVKKSAGPIDECIRLMTQMRDTWEEAFSSLSKVEEIPTPQPINQHGAAVLNIQS